jgi:hypothetical protein
MREQEVVGGMTPLLALALFSPELETLSLHDRISSIGDMDVKCVCVSVCV